MKLDTHEVGPLGAGGEMAYERGSETITHEDGDIIFNGKLVDLMHIEYSL